MSTGTRSYPIIDSHIHLYPASELETLAWCTPDNPLAKQHSVEDYATAVGGTEAETGVKVEVDGFIFVETDRKNADSTDWTQPLAEISWLRRIAMGEPRDGEGHQPAHAKLVKAVVPWAPVILGEKKVTEYLEKAKETAGPAWDKVKGFRYLLQFGPNGVMLKDDFISGLKVLGKHGKVFEVGVDQHRRGRIQLEETAEMIDKAHDGVPEDEQVVFVLNHLCKPDLSIINTNDPAFIAWRTAMFTLSRSKKVYMKLSGCFSEMPDKLKEQPVSAIFQAIFPWLAVILAAFGPSRIMFGSDWPVCTVGLNNGAWSKWYSLVKSMCDMASLTEEDEAMIFGGTAKEAYKLDD